MRVRYLLRRCGLAVLTLLVGMVLQGSPVKAQETEAYFTGIEDLPVMPGLAEIPDAGLIFDKPSGRIVEAYAQGEVSEGAVLDFYQETLPQLGWLSQADNRFAREGEELTLQIRENEVGGIVVMFRLAPK